MSAQTPNYFLFIFTNWRVHVLGKFMEVRGHQSTSSTVIVAPKRHVDGLPHILNRAAPIIRGRRKSNFIAL